jgi:hypothetical protein
VERVEELDGSEASGEQGVGECDAFRKGLEKR